MTLRNMRKLRDLLIEYRDEHPLCHECHYKNAERAHNMLPELNKDIARGGVKCPPLNRADINAITYDEKWPQVEREFQEDIE